MKRRFLAFLLVLCMAAGLLPAAGAAAEGSQRMSFYFVSYDEGTYTVDWENGPWGGFGGGEGQVRYILPFIGDMENPQYITDGLQSDNTDIVTVEKITDDSSVYWKITFKSHNTATLSYTDNGNTYIIDINPGPGGDPEPQLLVRQVYAPSDGYTEIGRSAVSGYGGGITLFVTPYINGSKTDAALVSSSDAITLTKQEIAGEIIWKLETSEQFSNEIPATITAAVDNMTYTYTINPDWSNFSEPEQALELAELLPPHEDYATPSASSDLWGNEGSMLVDFILDNAWETPITEGITSNNTEIVTVEKSTEDGQENFWIVTFKSGGSAQIIYQPEGNEGSTYTLDVNPNWNPGPDGPDEPSAPGSEALSFRTLDGEQYYIGFLSFVPDTDVIGLFDGGYYGYPRGDEDVYTITRDCVIGTVKATSMAGPGGPIETYSIPSSDDENAPKFPLKRLWFETAEGDTLSAGCFSFSNDFTQPQTEATLPASAIIRYDNKDVQMNNAAILNAKTEYGATAIVRATVTVDGQDRDIFMTVRIYDYSQSGGDQWERPQNDTVDALNAFLAAADISEDTNYFLKLGTNAYEGTIVLPQGIKNGKQLFIESDGASITGGIDLNGSDVTAINHITFTAPQGETGTTRAVYNGSCRNLQGCSFYNYDIAADSTIGFICPTSDNVFVGNKTACRIDFANNKLSTNAAPWRGNWFVNNETAVQVVTLGGTITPLNFRIIHSNFISNGTDFDAAYEGQYYLYRNYFGTLNAEASASDLIGAKTCTAAVQYATRRPAVISSGSGVSVCANPRWIHPYVSEHNEQHSADNYLVSDWENATRIQNSEANELIIDERAFAEDGEKVITVADNLENNVVFWTFGAQGENN